MRTLSIIALIAATATPALAERDPGDLNDFRVASMNEQANETVTSFDFNGAASDGNTAFVPGDQPGGPGQRG